MASATRNSKVDSIFIGSLQTRLQQESSGCAAAEHRSVWVTGGIDIGKPKASDHSLLNGFPIGFRE